MPTLTEAAHILRISEKTLRKWIHRLNLAPERHAYDLRYWTLTPEQVEAIRDARAQMPGTSQASILGKNALRAKSDGSVGSEASLWVSPMPRQRPLQGDGFRTMADGYRWLARHGVNERTPKSWPGVASVERTPRAFLVWALSVKQPGNHRQPWELARCDDGLCVCHELLAE